jgi:hypothetical protein
MAADAIAASGHSSRGMGRCSCICAGFYPGEADRAASFCLTQFVKRTLIIQKIIKPKGRNWG